jgi:hypothetical protein
MSFLFWLGLIGGMQYWLKVASRSNSDASEELDDFAILLQILIDHTSDRAGETTPELRTLRSAFLRAYEEHAKKTRHSNIPHALSNMLGMKAFPAAEAGSCLVLGLLYIWGIPLESVLDASGRSALPLLCLSPRLFSPSHVPPGSQHALTRRSAPLHLAAQHGRLAAVQALVEDWHVPVDARTQNGNTALHIACAQKHADVVVYLLAKGARLDITNSPNGEIPLHLAAQSGCARSVKVNLPLLSLRRI